MSESEFSTNLKGIVSSAAAGFPIPAYVPYEEKPKDPNETNVSSEPTTPQPENVTPTIVDSPVTPINPERKPPIDPFAQALMNTPGPESDQKRSPVPSMIGLDPSILDTPTPVMNTTPNKVNGEELYRTLLFSEDGDFTESQSKILKDHLSNVASEQERRSLVKDILGNVASECRGLLAIGMSIPEACQMAYDRTIAALDKINEEYHKNHSEVGTIILDKTQDVNDLGLTPEEHAKLERVRKVRLVLLEDTDLASIEIERPDEEHKGDYIKSIEGSFSKYSVPLPMLGDFISVKGAQIIQMVNIVHFEDSKLEENIGLKASLVYDKLITGSILKKFNEFGENKMSYTEFINKFPYPDLDIAIFGIICASTMEEASATLNCPKCSHAWTHHYNVKTLLKLDAIPESYKERTEEILKNKTNDVKLRELYEKRRKVQRYKSPFSGNIYDLSYPTIARAINILKRINEEDKVMAYNSAIALYLSQLLIYNGKTNKYVPVTAEEADLLLETLKSLPNEDMTMLANKIREDLYYSARFELEYKCPSCGYNAAQPLDIDSLIFLRAQDSEEEIE